MVPPGINYGRYRRIPAGYHGLFDWAAGLVEEPGAASCGVAKLSVATPRQLFEALPTGSLRRVRGNAGEFRIGQRSERAVEGGSEESVDEVWARWRR
jgi:hypothetical protein